MRTALLVLVLVLLPILSGCAGAEYDCSWVEMQDGKPVTRTFSLTATSADDAASQLAQDVPGISATCE